MSYSWVLRMTKARHTHLLQHRDYAPQTSESLAEARKLLGKDSKHVVRPSDTGLGYRITFHDEDAEMHAAGSGPSSADSQATASSALSKKEGDAERARASAPDQSRTPQTC